VVATLSESNPALIAMPTLCTRRIKSAVPFSCRRCLKAHRRTEQAWVCRLLKAHDLITSPAYVVIKAADQFHTKTTRPNEMWQTDFTYFKIIGWGWMYLSTVLDDFSRYIIAWKLCTNMRAEDVTDMLDIALKASGRDSATVLHKPRLLSMASPSANMSRSGRT
jgi:putative transposase